MLAEGEKPGLNEAGFDATYPWSVMNVAYGIYSGKTTVRQLDSIINYNDSVYPKNAMRMYFTTNHDENSWNGTEFERFGEASKTFAVWAFTMGKSIPLIYSGQEEPNKKRLKFFIKDTIVWHNYSLASFYKSLIALRESTPALAADASFSKLRTEKDDVVYAYAREKNGQKAVIVLNLSPKQQKFKIRDDKINGEAKDAFSGAEEKMDQKKIINLSPWAWLVYIYNAK
jgi:glycosidase